MATDFSTWLTRQLAQRKISPAALAKASRKSPAIISRILSGERQPAPETLEAIARALSLPPETVFRAAGLLPPRPAVSEESERAAYLFDSYANPETRRQALEYLEFLKIQEERGN